MVAAPSFPNSIWERDCLRNSIAFPNRVNLVNPVQKFPNPPLMSFMFLLSKFPLLSP